MKIDTKIAQMRNTELVRYDRIITRESLGTANAHLERWILATPTGEERNALCDANSHLQAAVDCINKADAARGGGA